MWLLDTKNKHTGRYVYITFMDSYFRDEAQILYQDELPQS